MCRGTRRLDKEVGRPRGLTLAQGLKATLMYFKDNITEEVIAEPLFVSQSVISETISTLEAVIVKALKDFEADLAEAAEGLAGRLAVIDGSPHPCWSWKDKKNARRRGCGTPAVARSSISVLNIVLGEDVALAAGVPDLLVLAAGQMSRRAVTVKVSGGCSWA